MSHDTWNRSLLFAAALLLGCVLPGRAESAPRPRVVIVKTRDIPFYAPAVDGFVAGMRTRGYRANDRIDMAIVSLTGKQDQDAQLVKDQLQRKPALIVSLGTDATRLIADQNPTVPVVFSMILDPISLGLAKTMDAPGGVFTGTTLLVSPGKQLEAFAQAAPQAHRLGVLYTDKDSTSLSLLQEARDEGKKLNIEVVAVPVADDRKPTRDILQQLDQKVDALWLIPDPASTGTQAISATMDFAKAHHLPVLGASSGTVHAGALLALSADLKDLGDIAADMAARILDNTSQPAQMRVRGPRRVLLSLNLQAARSLSIKIPREVLQLADEVVDSPAGGP